MATKLWRTVPLRFTNQPPGAAAVRWETATWWCACGAHEPLRSYAGAVSGPTPETVTRCPACGRVFFVIPYDKPRSRPIEVIELASWRDVAA